MPSPNSLRLAESETQMASRLRRLLSYLVPLGAVLIMVVGLWPEGAPLSDEVRVETIASNIKCPACGGASVADAESGIARDFYDFIGEQVAAGMSDGEIYEYWAARFGRQALLSPPTTGWGLSLWVLPAAGLVVGAMATAGLRRRSRSEPVATIATAERETVS